MKILFLSQIVPFPPKGGVLQRGYYIIRELSREHEIHLLAFIHQDVLHEKEDIRKAREALSKFCESVEFIPLDIKKSKLRLVTAVLKSVLTWKPFSVIAYSSGRFKLKIKAMLQQKNCDLIHFDTISLSIYLDNKYKGYMTVTHHNIESELMYRKAAVEKNYFKRTFLKWNGTQIERWEKKYIPLFDLNITCSERDTQFLLNTYDNLPIITVPNGVDTRYFKALNENEDDGLLIHVGALQSANLDGMLYFLNSIWPRIKEKNANIKLLLIGSNTSQDIINFANNDNNIELTGFVEDIRSYVANAAVFIVPLRYGGGTKLKVLDSLSMAKAVVTTTIGAEGITVVHKKHIVIADTPGDFADQVVFLCQDREKRKKMGDEGRKLMVENYDWSSIGAQLRNDLDNLVANTGVKN